MAKLICTFEGSNRHIEYTSDNGCKGILEGSRMEITDTEGKTRFKSASLVNGNIKMLIDLTDNMPELFNDYMEEHLGR